MSANKLNIPVSRAICEATTAGEWLGAGGDFEGVESIGVVLKEDPSKIIALCGRAEAADLEETCRNADFIAHARTALPQALGELEEARSYRNALEQRMIGSNMEPLLTGNADADLMRFAFREQEIALSPEAGVIAELRAELEAAREQNAALQRALRLYGGHLTSSLAHVLAHPRVRELRPGWFMTSLIITRCAVCKSDKGIERIALGHGDSRRVCEACGVDIYCDEDTVDEVEIIPPRFIGRDLVSPASLHELLALADEVGNMPVDIEWSPRYGGFCTRIHCSVVRRPTGYGATRNEAVINALYAALGGE